MTDQVNLEVIWGSTGSSTDPGDTNYKQGWLSEIPTFQEFNFVLKSLDTNILTLAEKGGWVWQADINYKAGASVITTAGKIARCKTDNINNDPDLDTNGDYWVSGMLLGAAAPNTLTIKDGVLIKDVNPRAATTWDGNDVTVYNDNALIALNTTGAATKNILVGNVSGSLVAIDVGTDSTPDGRSVALANANVHKIYHEGNKPTQANVSGTIPDSASNGKLYARKNGSWEEVTTTVVSDDPPPPSVGSGTGWFNLAEGRSYVDIDDGDSSQWVPSSPPLIPDTNISEVLPGTTIMWNGPTPPGGYLEENGGSYLRADYPELYAIIGTMFGSVDDDHFNVADSRGEFVRGWDNGRGVDPGRVFGSPQDHALEDHQHIMNKSNTSGTTNHYWSAGGDTVSGYAHTQFVDPGSNVANETRSRNITKMFCIKY